MKVILALLDHLREEFKNEPDYNFELYEVNIIEVLFKNDRICETTIIDNNIIVYKYFGGTTKKYPLSAPDSLEILNNIIKKEKENLITIGLWGSVI